MIFVNKIYFNSSLTCMSKILVFSMPFSKGSLLDGIRRASPTDSIYFLSSLSVISALPYNK